MTQLTEREIKHVAHLARIGVSGEEVAQYRVELSAVLDHVAQLEQVDTEGVAPMTHGIDMTNVLREDTVEACDEVTKDAIMTQVPETKDGYIKVRKVI
jgi:aspartyl-tRNA(Asn)/glutamyl-tRNA(Gln) amidotransferase subunit C